MKQWFSGPWKYLTVAVFVALVGSMAPIAVAQDPSEEEAPQAEIEHPEIVPLTLKNRGQATRLGDLGIDLGEEIIDVEGGVEVQAIVTKRQQAQLRQMGIGVGKALKTERDAEALQAEYTAMTAAQEAAEEEAEETGDDLRVQRAQWFNDPAQGRFLEVEVWSQAGKDSASVILNVAFDAGEGTEIGGTGTQSFNLSRFVDAGQYMFHRANSPVRITTENVPTRMRVRSILNGETVGERIVPVKETLTGATASGPGSPIAQSDTYQTSFVSKYVNATESYAKIQELAAEFPHLAEIIELPNKSNGYRRNAQALLDPMGNRVSIAGPAGATGDYAYLPASYGPAIPSGGFTITGFSLADGSGDAPANEGCGPYNSAVTGVVLVDRGSCNFTDKTKFAQDAGASAVIVVNNVSASTALTAPSGTALPGTTIPTIAVSMLHGKRLKEHLDATGRIQPGSAATPASASRVGIDSIAWGHEGGNDITIQAVRPSAANSPLSVSVSGKHVEVSLATNATGTNTSTAAQVVQAINNHAAASELVMAYTYRGSTGTGVLAPSAKHRLSDFLHAPDSVSREPFTTYALRIGRSRDGSKVGVLGYSQEHAREWVTPLVALESAERLLRNYDNDDNTKRLVNELDIFIIPSVNPDGTHYSIHDFTTQRRTMKRYCPVGGNNDLLARNTWGVDLNRNFSVGSAFDGYAGATTTLCTSDTFAGPAELSEPEAKNEVWLTDRHPNIKFSMNIHSHGGYFMWAPGAYKATGRENLPRPSYGTERFFYEASSHILNRIKEHRGTNIWDARIGPIADVLYSAAGNSGDEHYYNKGIFAWSFEVGAPRRNTANTGWTDVGFTPPYAEGYEEAMEFSSGLLGMFEVARLYARDTVKPKSELSPGAGTYSVTRKFTFKVSEPADVYYTTDGSRPTRESTKLAYQGPRQGEATFTLPKGAYTVKWFAEDVRGNVEGGYDPASRSTNFRQAKLTIK